MKRYLLALFILFHLTSVNAEVECQYEGSVREMNACAIRDYKRTFSAYTSAFQQKYQVLSPEERKNLVAESNFWATTVRKQCNRASRRTGSDETVIFYACLQQVMELRILNLLKGMNSSSLAGPV